MIIGRWSELRVVTELQRDPTTECAEDMARLGGELGLVRRILVGSFSLRRASSLFLR